MRSCRFFNNFLNSFFKQYWPSLLAGAMLATSFIPFPPWALGFCFSPLWWQVMQKSRSWQSAFFAGWCTQFVLSLIGFHWISFVAHEYGDMSWPLAVLVLLLFASTVHIYFAVSSAFGWYLHHRLGLTKFWAVLCMGLFVPLCEWWWPSLFPWNLGSPLLWVKSPLAQWADVFGFWGLGVLIHFLNVALVAAVIGESKNRRKLIPLVGVLAILTGLWSRGESHGVKNSGTPDKSVKILVIQANIANNLKLQGEHGEGSLKPVLERFFTLTREGLGQYPDSELVVWPETAFPDYLDKWNRQRLYSREMEPFAQSIGRPIITGGYSSDPPQGLGSPFPRKKIRSYNALFLISAQGQSIGTYHKTDLLAYGEYTPFSEYLPFLAKISPAGEGFARGNGPALIEDRGLRIGTQVCYEGLYPEFSSEPALRGAQLLVNLTNDSWFGPLSEPYQHLIPTMGRGIETRLPILRSTNTGISAALSASGEMLMTSPIGQSWFGQVTLPYSSQPQLTFYSRWGWLFPWLDLAVIIGLIYFARRKLQH